LKLEFQYVTTKRIALLCFFGAAFAVGQDTNQTVPKGYFTTLPVTKSVAQTSALMSANPLPNWNYSIVSSRNGNTYTGTIIGRSPYNRGKTTTNIPTQVIPLIITINDGTTTVTYDPTIVDPCVTPGSHTDVDVITGSPIFTAPAAAWSMGGVNVGVGLYHDAFQRAEFWSLLAGTPYHLVLNRSTLASQSVSFNSSQGTNYVASSLVAGACGNVGVISIASLDTVVQNLITGPLAGTVNTGTFPIFLTHNVVAAETGHSIFVNCCILGYHSGFNVGPNLQIYSPFSLDTSGLFGGDVSTLSHEMGEAINDPTTNNATPLWGGIGQVQPSPTPQTCQGNFEVGDPLSPGFPTGPFETPFTVVQNGLTYHMQELAYLSWFLGNPDLGTPGFYSNNSTFTGFAKVCPPGGTN
jgi:hypothetical protein